MKTKIFLVLISITLTASITAQNKLKDFIHGASFDISNIKLIINNRGNLETKGGYPGGFWKLLKKDSIIIYDHGLWVLGKINNQVYAGISQWNSFYSVGPIINQLSAMQAAPQDSLKYRVYKISRGDNNSNPDYKEWTKEFGAPVNSKNEPLLYGDQTLWTVYNALDTSVAQRYNWKANFAHKLLPFPVEIQQLAYSRKGFTKDSVDIFANTVFFEWLIINKGTNKIDSCFISLWTDIDFSGAQGNNPAVDTINQIGYLWDSIINTTDNIPSVGYLLLYGPSIKYDNETAVYKGKQKFGYKNLAMTSFHAILDDAVPVPPDNPARSVAESWNVVKGFETDGKKMFNPVVNKETKFQYTGDPITNEGWFPRYPGAGGAGFNMNMGPFNMAPNDTQWVMMALIPALGSTKYESIKLMRRKAKLLRLMPYDSLAFGRKPLAITSVKKEQETIPNEFRLFQNYPNPFNPETVISYQISAISRVRLKVYDLLGREVAILVDEVQQPGVYNSLFSILNSQLSSGVYFYRLTADNFSETRKMIFLK